MRTLAWLLGALLSVLLAGPAAAVELTDAPAAWDEAFPDQAGALRSIALEPETVQEGDQFRVTVAFDPAYPLERVEYQICEVGNACFAIGVPLTPEGDGVWSLDTTDLPDYVPTLRQAVDFEGGQRIGVQLFLYAPGAERGNQTLFPEGLPDDDALYDEDYVAWSETHYLATTVQAADKDAPGPGAVGLLAILAASVALAARARRNRED